jgi:hypothetical protein
MCLRSYYLGSADSWLNYHTYLRVARDGRRRMLYRILA